MNKIILFVSLCIILCYGQIYYDDCARDCSSLTVNNKCNTTEYDKNTAGFYLDCSILYGHAHRPFLYFSCNCNANPGKQYHSKYAPNFGVGEICIHTEPC